ncbi:MAG: 4Fe-4S binding protein [Campylobacteraceae bacterium]|nr:4Fe-4S binding protein [Campylobacteraceae bacterium]
MFHQGRCVACGSCVSACTEDALALDTFSNETHLVPTPSKCTGCFKCVEVCSADALRQQG